MQPITQELINKFLDKKNVFAVVGVSKEPEKYGHEIYFDLKNAGYKVYPINPNAKMISNDKCYLNLRNLPEKPDVVDIVVPPKITEKIVKECKDLDIKMVWMQPGSESKKAIAYCQNHGIKVLYDTCVMIERKKKLVK